MKKQEKRENKPPTIIEDIHEPHNPIDGEVEELGDKSDSIHIDFFQSKEEVKQSKSQVAYMSLTMVSNKEYHACTNILQ